MTEMRLFYALLQNQQCVFFKIQQRNYLIDSDKEAKYRVEMKIYTSNTPQYQVGDSCQTPLPFNSYFQNNLMPKKILNGMMMKTQDQAQVNHKAQFERLKQKNELQDNSISSKPTFDIHEKDLENQSQIIKSLSQLKITMNLNRSFDLKLLYRASQNNFDVEKFHQVCGNISNTLVLAQVLNGNIFGGYSTLQWGDLYQKNGTYFKTDTNYQSFIFNFTTREKFKLMKQTNNKAIIACKYLGPSFGGYDISIGNFANKKYSSTCDFPVSYQKQIKQKNFKLTRRSLIGISQQMFLIKQWEVFEVQFHKKIKFEENVQTVGQSIDKQHIEEKLIDHKDFWDRLLNFFIQKTQKTADFQ